MEAGAAGRPQVLLLGNGVNRAYGGGSWGQLIRDITVNERIAPGADLHLPMPLRAILVTGDTVDVQLRQSGTALYGKVGDQGHLEALQELLDLGFDHILTTNFSYELEMAAQPERTVDDKLLTRLMRHTGERRQAEAKYLLHTYTLLSWQGRQVPVWHIHGEGRKPDSIILGHYYYANLLKKITSYLEGEGDRFYREQQRGERPRIKSWADAFLLGDVYILGFGFDVSEFDLWWLLNRKKKERAAVGETWFYAPEELSGFNEKEELLRVLGVKVSHLGMTRPEGTPLGRSLVFREFYHRAAAEIRCHMERARGERIQH